MKAATAARPITIEELTSRRILEHTDLLNDSFSAADEFLVKIRALGGLSRRVTLSSGRGGEKKGNEDTDEEKEDLDELKDASLESGETLPTKTPLLGLHPHPHVQRPPPLLRCHPAATSRFGSLLLSLSADVRSTDDVIALKGVQFNTTGGRA